MEDDPISHEKLKTFMNLFWGRQDAYGVETAGGPITKREPLTQDHYLSHFKGTERIGIFPIFPDNTVKWALIDIDHLDKTKVEKIIIALISNGIFYYLEISKSKGFHIWIFFDEPVSAHNVRLILNYLLKEANIEGFEIFPKQDTINQGDGLGNYVFLPLYGESVKEKRTVFLNNQFEPYENQWEQLSKIHFTKSENLLSLIKEKGLDKKLSPRLPPIQSDKAIPPRGVKICYWKALNDGVQERKPGRHMWALRIAKYLRLDLGFPPDIAKVNLVQWNQKNRPPLTEQELNADRTIRDGPKYDWGCNDEVLKIFCSPECKFNKKSEAVTEDLPSEDLICFIERKIENPEALIGNGILPKKGQLITGGHSKQGKSTLADNMGLNLSTATAFLNQFPIPKARRGCLFQAEISEISMQDRLQKMIRAMAVKPKPGFLSVINKKGLNLNRPKDFDQICRLIEAHEAEYVIFDPMYRFHSGDENKSSEMKNFFSRLDELEDKFGLAVILVHHFGKPSEAQRDGAQMLRGSSTIFDYGDSYLSLKRQSRNKPKEYVTLSFELRNAEDPQALHLWRNPDTLWYEVQGADTETLISDHDILKMIQSSGGAIMRSELIEKVVKGFKVSKGTAKSAIDHCKNFLIEEHLKEKGSPVRFTLKPHLVFGPIHSSESNREGDLNEK